MATVTAYRQRPPRLESSVGYRLGAGWQWIVHRSILLAFSSPSARTVTLIASIVADYGNLHLSIIGDE